MKNLEATESHVAYAGKGDDLRKLYKALHGGNALQVTGSRGSTQMDIQHGEEIAERGKRTLEECTREKSSFLRNTKFARRPRAI